MLEHIEEKHEDEIEEIDIEPEQGADGATKEELLNKMRDDIRKRKQARMGREIEEEDDIMEDTVCVVCMKKHSSDKILMCENYEHCGVQKHTFCCDPPLDKVPEDEWYCSFMCKNMMENAAAEEKFQASLGVERQRVLDALSPRHRDAKKKKGGVIAGSIAYGMQAGNLDEDVEIAHLRRTNFLLNHWSKVEPFLGKESEVVKSRLIKRMGGWKEGMQPEYQHDFSKTPKFIQGEMRPYQLEGLEWMVRKFEEGANGIMGDEMGLGKTLQTISFLAYIQQMNPAFGPFLILCPLSVMPAWEAEFKRWCPTLSTFTFHGNQQDRTEMKAQLSQPGTRAADANVLLMTYETLVRDSYWFSERIYFRVIVLDEAQRIKNEASQVGQAVRAIQSAYRLLLTGTPLQNNLRELWALMNFLYPEVFTKDLKSVFGQAFQLAHDGGVGVIKDEAKMSAAHSLLNETMLRRLKVNVLKGLIPPKTEIVVKCDLSPVQRWHYRNLLKMNIGLTNDANGEQGQVKYASTTALLMQLWKCCLHPFLFEGVQKCAQDLVSGQWKNVVDENLIYSSGKLCILDKLLSDIYKSKAAKKGGGKVIIFSQYTSMLNILEEYCSFREYKYVRLDGQTALARRKWSMHLFNRDYSENPEDRVFIFLVSTKAGGVGINLQTADNVVIYDSSWNPYVDLQAQDRAHRMGQKNAVTVYRFITDDTCESRVRFFAEQKLAMKQSVLRELQEEESVLESVQQDDAQESNSFAKLYDKADIDDMIRFGQAHLLDEDDGNEDPGLEVGRKFYDHCTEQLQLQMQNLKSIANDLGDTRAEAAVAYRRFDNTLYVRKDKKNIEVAEREVIREQTGGQEAPPRVPGVRSSKRLRKQTGSVMTHVKGLGKIAISRWSYEQEEARKLDAIMEKNRREAQKMVSKRVMEHEDVCGHCSDHVLKATVVISTEANRDGKLVQKKRLVGSQVTCSLCPVAMHTTCRALPCYQPLIRDIPHAQCPQHRCWVCRKGMTEVGLLMFRCVSCLMAFCWNCSEQQKLQDKTEYLAAHPTWEESKGYRAPQTTEYMRCPNCIDKGIPIPSIENASSKRGKSLKSSPSGSPSASRSESPTPSEFETSRATSSVQCQPCSPKKNAG